MAWTPTLPSDLEKLKDSPAIFRAMWAAIATGTDPALLITNDKVSSTAGIVDTKLAQITTASKVSGTALTGLASIPSGAGVIPVANIPDLAASKITTGQLAIARGGTNLSSAGGDANRVLLTTDGAVFSMGQVNLASMVTGTLPTGSGGTGSTADANAANGVVVLDDSSRLPAVDGSQLTGLLGAWVDKSSSYGAQQAATDGFVVFTATNDNATEDFSLIGYSDSNADPTTVRAKVYIKQTTIEQSGHSWHISFPVKKGDYWKVVLTKMTVEYAYWIPLGS